MNCLITDPTIPYFDDTIIGAWNEDREYLGCMRFSILFCPTYHTCPNQVSDFEIGVLGSFLEGFQLLEMRKVTLQREVFYF